MSKGSLDVLLDQLGIRCIPVYRKRERCQTHARGAMKALRAQHGDGHLVFVLKTIKQSRGNATELWSETIGAVSDIVLQRPDWSECRAGDFMATFDDMPLGTMREAAVALRPWPVRTTLRVLIMVELEKRMNSQGAQIAA
ncbi:hypothetical protein C5748_22000 [Phyllobacterium phragmitis]|uniref:Uncharacterized protein n=1 Tax=Phyllobacterium phragmitis TaxID=2670329 RepID=A0A2S9ILF5_9HYPH|nr:hypothetical protein [Phyllobacterium phragmitis]PRD41363.1 hypothetical protein C5748_22000 [Phyllobacterium phragmitis]